MSATQDVVHGAWARRAISVGGSPRFETQRVVWLQAGTCFADMRVPFVEGAETRCFSGRSGWDGDNRYRWTRHLDLAPLDGEDVGALSWEDGVLVERGMFPTPGGEVGYEEDWERLPDGDGPFLALEAASACLVRTGNHAISMMRTNGGMVAVYRVRRNDVWEAELAIGDGAETLPDPDDAPMWPMVHRGTTDVMV